MSAALSPDVIKGIDPSAAPLTSEQIALVTAIAIIAGGGLAGASGQNAAGAATSAEKEALNNATAGDHAANAAKNGGLLTALGTLLTGPSQVGNAMVNGFGHLLGMIGQTGSLQSPEGDPNAINGVSNQTVPGVAVVTPTVVPCGPGLLCSAPIIVSIPGSPGSLPGNAIFSSGSDGSRPASGTDGAITNSGVSQGALDTLAANGVKFTPQNVVATGTMPSGQIVFPETGNSSAGLQHIIDGHANDFANIRVSESQIPGVIMKAVSEANIVSYQGSGTGRPIYQTKINGQPQRIAVTVGTNGFIVGANPAGSAK